MNTVFVFICIALISTISLHFILPAFAHSVGLIDHPNHRKTHKGHVPLIGGIAMYISFIVTLISINISVDYKLAFLISSGI
ncbi:MAG: undecaprenyl-phosphate alpha-N-acetylglucosaminyl 1-phosphate transferase, partial [Gammaproteobacteria bacterium]|nr:undecaprenyl-phosphate alpha-N-acetylglucosaminyl 1-phosphate transferase [Gammaproteobacteria bacterium]